MNGQQTKSSQGRTPPNIKPMTDKEVFLHQCEIAKAKSLAGCTQHVNTTCGLLDDEPVFLRFYVSDWYDSDATLRSFTNGRQHT